jgi:LmbE family N-acetylglucosaminyl deacetylase
VTEPQNPLTPVPVSMTVQSRDLPTPARALAIGAHPDDIDFGCGATLAKWAAAGCEVSVLVCTDGAKGTWEDGPDLARLVATRQDEQRAAARALDARGEVVFLGWPDGDLESGPRQRWQVTSWIRRLRPAVVLGHDPWKRYRLHPDHRHAGWLATDGVVAARDATFYPEQGDPAWRPQALLLFEADEPDHAEDVTGFAEAKVAALLAHESQFRSTMHATNDTELDRFRNRVTDRLETAGRAVGVAQAEVYKLIDDL